MARIVVVFYSATGNVAALAEAHAAGRPDLLYLGVGTGVGGGIVLGGRLLPGPSRGSCEIGHLIVDRSAARCDCGRRGCVQSVASGPAVLRRAARGRGAEVTFAEWTSSGTLRHPSYVATRDDKDPRDVVREDRS